jgi:hypothetical protein
MRLRPTSAIIVGLALLVPVTASSAAEPSGEAVQTVAGTILVHNPTKAAANVTRHARSAGLVANQSNGIFGWFFKVDPSSLGGEFTLTSTTAGADLDIIFYADPGTLADAPTAAAEFLGSAGDGERGIIPGDTTHVLIYPAGAPNAAFAYTGYAIPRVQIGVDDLNVSTAVGGSVTWVNKTADYTFVRGATFGSGTAPGTGIPVNGSYTATFTKAGTFVYDTSVGTGTVTVS